MIEKIHRIYINGGERKRFFEIINKFEDINQKIISNQEAKQFSRVIIELTEEELTLLTISFDPEHLVILDAKEEDVAGNLYDQLMGIQYKR